MSVFDFPRIHVVGTQQVNPGTANNNSASPGEELTVTSDSERVVALTNGKSDAEFQRWITALDSQNVLRCQWNYYGDMSFRFTDVRVRTIQLGPEELLRAHADDALIGASVHLNNAIVCDNNPEGFNGTQVFAEALELHAPDALRGPGSFISRPPDRATTRWLNWQRNVSFQGVHSPPVKGATGEITSGAAAGASASFQCGIEVRPEDLEEDRGGDRSLDRSRFKLLARDGASRGLSALIDALRRGARGLVFRYNLYLCYPRISDTALAAMFARGARPVNPAIGKVIGTIAPWYPGEPSTATLGRLLKPAAAFVNRHRSGTPFYLAPAIASQHPKTGSFSIDLANTLPEDGPEGDKYNLGTVELGFRRATPAGVDPALNPSEVEPIGEIRNDRESYLDRGGIYDLPFSNDAAVPADSELVVRTSLHGVLLYEPEYMLTSDCTCNYLDELPPGTSWQDPSVREYLGRLPHQALRGEIDLWLLRRGQPPNEPVQVRVEEWRQTPTGFHGRYGVYRYPTLLSRRSVTVERARSQFQLAPSQGSGLRVYRFVPERSWPADIDERTFAHRAIQESIVELRILSYDDYSHVRDDELTFSFVYREVLRYYHLLTPAMSQAIDVSDPAVWNLPSALRYVLLTTALDRWDSWQFMPRTRDLSRSRRELLQRFCELELRQHGQRDA